MRSEVGTEPGPRQVPEFFHYVRDVLEFPRDEQERSTSAFHFDLARDHATLEPSRNLVLDPFSGSTTAKAAGIGAQVLGAEINRNIARLQSGG